MDLRQSSHCCYCTKREGVRYVEGLAGFLDADGKAKTDFKSLCDLAGYIDEDELIITPEGDIYLAMHE